jgi:hypothetical protein
VCVCSVEVITMRSTTNKRMVVVKTIRLAPLPFFDFSEVFIKRTCHKSDKYRLMQNRKKRVKRMMSHDIR